MKYFIKYKYVYFYITNKISIKLEIGGEIFKLSYKMKFYLYYYHNFVKALMLLNKLWKGNNSKKQDGIFMDVFPCGY